MVPISKSEQEGNVYNVWVEIRNLNEDRERCCGDEDHKINAYGMLFRLKEAFFEDQGVPLNVIADADA